MLKDEQVNILIFRTDIKTKKRVEAVRPIFDNHPTISDWSIDLWDIDNVLRIEASENLAELEVIQMLQINGFQADVLPD